MNRIKPRVKSKYLYFGLEDSHTLSPVYHSNLSNYQPSDSSIQFLSTLNISVSRPLHQFLYLEHSLLALLLLHPFGFDLSCSPSHCFQISSDFLFNFFSNLLIIQKHSVQLPCVCVFLSFSFCFSWQLMYTLIALWSEKIL